jgi:putative DNA primase/helicase
MSSAQIARALGLRPAGGEFTGRCPCCGYPSGFSIAERNGRTLLYCHAGGCSQADLIEALRKAGLWHNAREPRPTTRDESSRVGKPPTSGAPDRDAQILAMWRRSRPVADTLAETYLRSRGYMGAIPAVLRFAAGRHPSACERWFPMLVAAVAIEGRADQVVALHRTFLGEDGRGKADIDPDKMTLGPSKGAAVALAPAGPALAVAEGIESGLSYMQATGTPTWAAVSAGGLRSLLLPPHVADVVIACDPDAPGMIAAHAAARRWLAEGRRVSLARPPLGLDFNDLARLVP